MPPTTMSTSGFKRPASSADDDDDKSTLVRPAQQPRLEVSESAMSSPDEAKVGNIDLICNIASFMDVGSGLTNVCVAVGPDDAAIIRREYLTDNDNYIVKSLRELNIPYLSASWSKFHDSIPLFDKCRDNIIAWLKVNKNWTKRCTGANIERYKQQGATMRLPIEEANLVFNNPAVAIEIGLLDIVSFLVEKKGVNVNDSSWNGFNSNRMRWNDSFARLALIRGDAALLRYILSVDGFDLGEITNADGGREENEKSELIHFALINRGVKNECTEIFLQHPNVNLNVIYEHGTTPLIEAVESFGGSIMDGNREMMQTYMKRIDIILDAGGDPRFEDVSGETPISYVREFWEESEGPNVKLWKEVLQKLETWEIE